MHFSSAAVIPSTSTRSRTIEPCRASTGIERGLDMAQVRTQDGGDDATRAVRQHRLAQVNRPIRQEGSFTMVLRHELAAVGPVHAGRAIKNLRHIAIAQMQNDPAVRGRNYNMGSRASSHRAGE
jgi:hypothetical protein